MKNKWPFLIALPFMIGYGIGVTFYYQQKVAYLCPNCQHIFSPSLWAVIKRNIQRQHVDSNVQTVMKRIIALKYLKRI